MNCFIYLFFHLLFTVVIIFFTLVFFSCRGYYKIRLEQCNVPSARLKITLLLPVHAIILLLFSFFLSSTFHNSTAACLFFFFLLLLSVLVRVWRSSQDRMDGWE